MIALASVLAILDRRIEESRLLTDDARGFGTSALRRARKEIATMAEKGARR